ncbi:O-glucosyltransferase rumi-like [Eurosta solidaginis]|uniref:O-glucosyltransferase rumi-like n=1 Tax=Eurosta solidaginis TaxID=178769 RepID=UPI0035309BF4
MEYWYFLIALLFDGSTKIFATKDKSSGDVLLRDNDEDYSSSVNKNNVVIQITTSLESYAECENHNDSACNCYHNVIQNDLKPYQPKGVTQQMIENTAKYGTRYKINNKRLYRDSLCLFPARCSGIEHFLLKLLPELPDLDMVINTRDWPQVLKGLRDRIGPIFSFSKTDDYLDLMYPAWTFWAGGPAISLHPTGIGRWDLFCESITKAANQTPWSEKLSLGFFRGSRTSDERDALILLSRRRPELVDAQYTKNQAWKSLKDTLNAEPAKEVSFEEHCRYKYLFNFRGVAASFRFKHLFLCNSLVFHVGNEWNEFFYFAMKPWVHYVPLKSYPSELEIENILKFFIDHDELAREIAKRGRKFILEHLRMQDIECYWKKLVLEYQKLLRFSVQSDPDFILIQSNQRDEL